MPRQRPPEGPRAASEAPERVEDAKGAMDRFRTLTHGLLGVTREHLEAEERRYQRKRAAKARKKVRGR